MTLQIGNQYSSKLMDYWFLFLLILLRLLQTLVLLLLTFSLNGVAVVLRYRIRKNQLKTITNVKEEDVDLTLLSGYKVIDKKAGVIGKIEQVLDYNQNFLFQVLHGKRTILIPINEEIIVKVNHQKKEVIIAAPEGLLDLFS